MHNKRKDQKMSNIAYLRISHSESLNGTSLEVQEKRCMAYAELHGFKIDKVYSEICSGGVEFRKRPVFQKVQKELQKGSRLVVSRLDRLSRRVIDTLKIVDDFKKQHQELCITDIGNVHTDGVSKIFITILASLAEIERENVSQRIRASKEIMQKENRYLGGIQKFGFTKNDDGSYSVNPKEQEIFNAIINLKENKVALRKICEVIKNKFGRKLHYSYISKLMKRNDDISILRNNQLGNINAYA